MIGLGTIINTAAIILGGLGGMLFGKKIPDPDECIAIVKAYDQVGTPEA